MRSGNDGWYQAHRSMVRDRLSVRRRFRSDYRQAAPEPGSVLATARERQTAVD